MAALNDSADELLVIYGPTATGKTAASIELAQRLGGEVVSADSVQVYRGFDIGSAKPSLEERRGVVHHLIDVVDPDENLDAQRYADLADVAIQDIQSRGRLPIVAGGTGLWLRALLRGLVELPAVDLEVRERWESQVREWGPERSHAELDKVDPITAKSVHQNDALRIVRALEVLEQTGRPLGELRQEHALGAPRYRAAIYVLAMDRTSHDERIAFRTNAMFEAGWEDEVALLRERWGDSVRPFGSVGYREVLAAQRGELPRDELHDAVRRSTRVYARRQRTWAGSIPNVRATLRAEDLMRDEPFALKNTVKPAPAE